MRELALSLTRRSLTQFLWFAATPVALAAIGMEVLVPRASSEAPGPLGAVARFGQRSPIALAAGLFLLFATLAHYWRFYLPGGRLLAGAAESRGTALGFALAVGAAAGLGLALRATCFESYTVLSASMLPSLEPGDRVIGSKLARLLVGAPSTRSPRRGDVVVFRSDAVALSTHVALPEVLVKRVIGLAGDQVAMQAGSPVINGWQVPSCDAGMYFYILPGAEGGALQARLRVEFLENRAYLIVRSPEGESKDPYEVKPGEMFVLGDNRNSSLDSRAYNNGRSGGVPVLAIQARVVGLLQGTHRDGSADFRRLFAGGVDSLQVHEEGVDIGALRAGVERCLKARPRDAYPPMPSRDRRAAAPAD